MKKILFVAAVLISSIAYSQTTIIDSIWVDSLYRSYKIYIPSIYNPANPTPLVFNFHGYGGNYNQTGNFKPIADTANFIIVMPQGDSVPLLTLYYPGWNNFNSVADFDKDKNFISNLIDTLKTQLNVDLDRVYAAGGSNGGFMSYDLACFLSSRFAAIASVVGSMTSLHVSSCNPQHPTPVMEIHGTADSVVYYNGGAIDSSFMHIDSLVKHWVTFNNCSPVPVFSAVPNIIPFDSCYAQHYVYNGGDKGSSVELYKVIDGGHTWPGSGFTFSGPKTCMDFSASVEIWRFFRKYNLASLTSGINEISSSAGISSHVFPNPFNDFVKISYELTQPAETYISVYNIYGSEIKQLAHQNNSAGTYSIFWDGKNSAGTKVPAGIYFYTIHAGKSESCGKIILLSGK
ncbi:MAG: T9SS type A sorting domain-containing protein [Bacteroidetes bacterium]|nr:T9SS type A sorting domain-containing protein [Bacteroidota bacterium]